MKHTWQITLILIGLFIVSQIVGLFVVNSYLDKPDLPLGIERPDIEENISYIPVLIAILFATGIALLLIKFNAVKIWKIWFFIGVVVTLTITFGSFIPEVIALILGLGFAFFKIFRTNVIVHNFTEIFIYPGIAAIFVPIFNLMSIFILLVVISVYDIIAVWKTKHMVKMAEFQSETKIFAGLLIPYKKTRAVLGGGDIGFPLMFAGVVMKTSNMLNGVIVSLFAALGLFLLFYMAKKEKFYPAMPFVTAGCVIGYLITLLL